MQRTLTFIATAAFALSLAGMADARAAPCRDADGHFTKCRVLSLPFGGHPKQCSKGKRCGDSCIAREKVCHIR